MKQVIDCVFFCRTGNLTKIFVILYGLATGNAGMLIKICKHNPPKNYTKVTHVNKVVETISVHTNAIVIKK